MPVPARPPKTKPIQLGATADQVYALAKHILAIQKELDEDEGLLVRKIALKPSDPEVHFWRDQLEEARARRHVFESRLGKDPLEAVRQFEVMESTLADPRMIGSGRHGARNAAIATAVEQVEEWLRRRAGKGDESFLISPVLALQLVSSGGSWVTTLPDDFDFAFPGEPPRPKDGRKPLREEADLERLLEEPDVKEALKPTAPGQKQGPRRAAITIVSIVTELHADTIEELPGVKKKKSTP